MQLPSWDDSGLNLWWLQRSGGKWSVSRYIWLVEILALAVVMDIEGEVNSGFYPELLSEMVCPFTKRKTRRGAGLRTETKIIIYSFNKYLLSPYHVLRTMPSLRDKTVNKLKPLTSGSLHSSGRGKNNKHKAQ